MWLNPCLLCTRVHALCKDSNRATPGKEEKHETNAPHANELHKGFTVTVVGLDISKFSFMTPLLLGKLYHTP